eukprot:7133878-Karenia_brevis.AAC.1
MRSMIGYRTGRVILPRNNVISWDTVNDIEVPTTTTTIVSTSIVIAMKATTITNTTVTTIADA